MMTTRPRPTDAEFEALKRDRDAALREAVEAFCRQLGWDPDKVQVHHSHAGQCYCDCPAGPCQHVWDGPEYSGDTKWSRTCSRCGTLRISHDMRVCP